jgi:hypothetical protein
MVAGKFELRIAEEMVSEKDAIECWTLLAELIARLTTQSLRCMGFIRIGEALIIRRCLGLVIWRFLNPSQAKAHQAFGARSKVSPAIFSANFHATNPLTKRVKD